MNSQIFRTNRFLLPVVVTGVLALVAPANGQVINEDVKLLPIDGSGNDRFGSSISISDGVVAVGAQSDNDNGSNSGSAYLFDASTGVQIAKLLPSDGAGGDQFGWSIAIADGVVAVGSQSDDDNGSNSGSAYLFDAVTGVQIFKLLPSDGAAGDQFGWSIAIGDGVVAVGAQSDDDNGSNSGSAYLFDAVTGVQIFKLLPSDGAAGDQFGWSIAIGDGVVAVGAQSDDDNGSNSGSVYLFDAATGVQIDKLLPNDGAAGDVFGYSIAIDNGVVAVGAYLDDDNGGSSGSAYLFNAATGVQIAKLLPSDGFSGGNFGFSIAIADGVVAVGMRLGDDNGSNSGSAYLFDASTGGQFAKLIADDGAAHDHFGYSIAISNGVVAVGSRLDDDKDNGGDSGSAYLFDATTGVQIIKLLASDGSGANEFGYSVGIDNGVVAVGAHQDNDNGSNSGSAYVFTVPGADCPADLTGDGVLNFFDISAFLAAFASGDLVADFNDDGVFNFFDISAFLAAFSAGCP